MVLARSKSILVDTLGVAHLCGDDMSLGGGALGVGALAAMVFEETGEPRLRRAAADTLCLLHERLPSTVPMSFFGGAGGLVFVAERYGPLLGLRSSRRLTDALLDAIVERPTPESLDPIDGLPGLTVVARHLRDSSRRKATYGAIANAMMRAWTGGAFDEWLQSLPHGPEGCGIAHGVLGVYLALGRLAHAGARVAPSFQAALFDELRSRLAGGVTHAGWCNGGAGLLTAKRRWSLSYPLDWQFRRAVGVVDEGLCHGAAGVYVCAVLTGEREFADAVLAQPLHRAAHRETDGCVCAGGLLSGRLGMHAALAFPAGSLWPSLFMVE